jgi:hypothetical protein
MYCVIYDRLNLAQYRRCPDTKACAHQRAQKIKESDETMINERTTSNDDSTSGDENKNSSDEPTRDEERGESSEPDAPTSGEENDGMNTILDGGLGTGVQEDVDDE